jgi:hypothetical protein
MLSQILDLLVESEKELAKGKVDMGHVLLLEAVRLLKVHNDSDKQH